MSARLRILLAHSYYRSSAPSGEDAVFESERRLLESNGVTVIPFIRRNDDLDDASFTKRVRIATGTVWARDARSALEALIRAERPDVVHFHNTFPQISPSAYAACCALGVPVIQTLHNYRLVCANALLQREGRPCEDCLSGGLVVGLWPGLWHRCYRNSIGATGALTLMLAVNRVNGSYRRNVDRYIALTQFAASRLAAGGLPSERICVKPNFLPNPPSPGGGNGGYAVYVGRLSEEKGVVTLLRAWSQLFDVPLKVVGDGPLASELKSMAQMNESPVEFLGFRSRSEVLQIVSNAAVQIVPSEWYEGFPMVILEAFACGTPVVAARIGSLDEIVKEGTLGMKFQAGSADDLVRAVRSMLADSQRLSRMRGAVRATFEKNYTAESNIRQLLEIYEQVLSARTPRPTP